MADSCTADRQMVVVVVVVLQEAETRAAAADRSLMAQMELPAREGIAVTQGYRTCSTQRSRPRSARTAFCLFPQDYRGITQDYSDNVCYRLKTGL